MKKIALILVLALLLGCACAEPAFIKAFENVDLIDNTNLLRVEGENGYALADLDGNVLTEDIYSYSFYYDNGLITGNLYEGGLSSEGAFKLDGSVALPFQYGDIRVESNQWAVGIALTEATRDNFDYESWSDDAVYLIDYVDIYNLATGAKLTLPRSNYASCKSYGSTLNVEDRSTGKATAYDANFNVLGQLDSVYDEDYASGMVMPFREDGSYGLKMDETVILEPTYDYIYDFRGDYAIFETEDGSCGLLDQQGNVVVPAEYDDFENNYTTPYGEYGYEGGGYFCVIKDGKMGYVAAGGVTCEPKYSEDILENNGASATFTDMEGNFNILAADGVVTTVEGYDRVSAAYNAGGFYYEVTDADYNHGLIDWHGNVVFPCEYADIAISGDGNYALVEVDYGEYELYSLNSAAPAAAVSEAAPAVAPAEAAASEQSAFSNVDLAGRANSFISSFAEKHSLSGSAADSAPAEIEAPVEDAPAPADEFTELAKTVLESAKLVASADAASTITLLDSAIAMLKDSPAVAILEGAKALLDAGNSDAALILIDNALAML